MASSSNIARLLNSFPPKSTVLAYGSAVLPQAANSGVGLQRNRPIDLLVIAPDLVQWYQTNVAVRPADYSALVRVGGFRPFVNLNSRNCGVVYFQHSEEPAKYGVVSEEKAEEDNRTWKWLHVAGRMQKPFLLLSDPPLSPSLQEAIEFNRAAALKAAFLLLPERFTTSKLLETICSLSYKGDPRMWGLEPLDKPGRLAVGQVLPLAAEYLPRLLKGEGGPVAIAGVPTPFGTDVGKSVEELKELGQKVLNAAKSNLMNVEAAWSGSKEQAVEMERALQDEGFLWDRDTSDETAAEVFQQLPAEFQICASAVSASVRVRRLVSPFSLLVTKNLQRPVGRPQPWDTECVDKALAKTVRRSATRVASMSLLANPSKSIQYVINKWRMSGK